MFCFIIFMISECESSSFSQIIFYACQKRITLRLQLFQYFTHVSNAAPYFLQFFRFGNQDYSNSLLNGHKFYARGNVHSPDAIYKSTMIA